MWETPGGGELAVITGMRERRSSRSRQKHLRGDIMRRSGVVWNRQRTEGGSKRIRKGWWEEAQKCISSAGEEIHFYPLIKPSLHLWKQKLLMDEKCCLCVYRVSTLYCHQVGSWCLRWLSAWRCTMWADECGQNENETAEMWWEICKQMLKLRWQDLLTHVTFSNRITRNVCA